METLIITLALAPGAMLTEGNLIELVGMGRTPVREAMQRLSWQGLLDIRPRSGVKVAEIVMDDFLHIMALRELLEPVLVATSIKRASAEQRAMLATLRETLLQSREAGDILMYLHADKAVDQYLFSTAADPYLENALSALQVHARRFWYHFSPTHNIAEGVNCHLAVIDACIAQNEAEGVAAMQALMRCAQSHYQKASGN